MISTSRILKIVQLDSEPVGFVSNPDFFWDGYPNQWKVTLSVESAVTGDAANNFSYDASSIEVGDWIATTSGGTANRIIEIVELVNSNSIVVIVEDEDSYNILADMTQTGTSIGPAGQGILFQVSPDNGLPVLGPMTPYYFDVSFQTDLISRFVQQGKLKSPKHVLTKPTDNSVTDGAIQSWVEGETSYTDAIDSLNSFMMRLLPDRPANLSSKAVEFMAVNNRETVLSKGFVNHTDQELAAGDGIVSVSESPVVSRPIEGFGSGESGTLILKVDGEAAGSVALTDNDDSGVYDSLEVLADQPYPDAKGFWRALDAQIAVDLEPGVHHVDLTHSLTGTTSATFAVDTLVAKPLTTAVSVKQTLAQAVTYSSGVPHYGKGSTLAVSATSSNLSGQTHLKQGVMQVVSEALVNSLGINPGEHGVPEVLDVNHAALAVVDVPVELSGDSHSNTTLSVRGRNSYTDGDAVAANARILYLHGQPFNGVIEQTRTISDSISMRRVAMTAGDTPADNVASFAAATFNSGSGSSAGSASAAHEASIVGGRLCHDVTDYSKGYLPVGPDFSGKDSIQYATFVTQGVTNNMRLRVNGEYTGLYIKLPGISQIMPNAVAGWWDATKQADFAPSRWPGAVGASDGCLVGSVGGDITITFGSASSSGATDNMIFIRFVLAAGQSITDIAIDF